MSAAVHPTHVAISILPNEPFTRLPRELNEQIIGFLDGNHRAILRLTTASRSLRDHPSFNRARNLAITTLSGQRLAPYLPPLQALFENLYIPILRLPF